MHLEDKALEAQSHRMKTLEDVVKGYEVMVFGSVDAEMETKPSFTPQLIASHLTLLESNLDALTRYVCVRVRVYSYTWMLPAVITS